MKMNKKKDKMFVQWVNVMLLVALAVVFLTGILLHPFQGVLLIKLLHKLFSVILVVGVIIHVVQHKKNKN